MIRRESIGRNVRVVAKMQKGWSVTGATAAGASCAKRTVATPMRTRTTKMGSPVGSVTYKALCRASKMGEGKIAPFGLRKSARKIQIQRLIRAE